MIDLDELEAKREKASRDKAELFDFYHDNWDALLDEIKKVEHCRALCHALSVPGVAIHTGRHSYPRKGFYAKLYAEHHLPLIEDEDSGFSWPECGHGHTQVEAFTEACDIYYGLLSESRFEPEDFE